MENFINVLLDFDKNFIKDLIKRLKNNEKLTGFENQYLYFYIKTIKDYQRRKKICTKI